MGSIIVRRARIEDAQGILEAHYSAVHETAAGDYPREVRDAWSMQVTAERIDQYLKRGLRNKTTVVAEVDGEIAGFGAIAESNSELRAVYVSAMFGRQGIGSAVLRELSDAKMACKKVEDT